MAHQEQALFIDTLKKHLPQFFHDVRVVEIGSYDYNGSIRKRFQNAAYIGVDITPGPGVDAVCSGHEYAGESNSTDVVLSCECFEHNPFWRETIANMARLALEEALVVFTCASAGRLEHGTARTNYNQSPGSEALGWSYYRNLTETEIRKAIDLDSLFSRYEMYYQPHSCDLYFWGIKKSNSGAKKISENALAQMHAEIKANVLSYSSMREGRSKVWMILNAPKHLLKWVLPEHIFQAIFLPYYRVIDKFINKLKGLKA